MRKVILDSRDPDSYMIFKSGALRQELVVINPSGDFFATDIQVQVLMQQLISDMPDSIFFIPFNGHGIPFKMPDNTHLVLMNQRAVNASAGLEMKKIVRLDASYPKIPTGVSGVQWYDFDFSNGVNKRMFSVVYSQLFEDWHDITMNFVSENPCPDEYSDMEVIPKELDFWGWNEYTPNAGLCFSRMEKKVDSKALVQALTSLCASSSPKATGMFDLCIPFTSGKQRRDHMVLNVRYEIKDGVFVKFIGRVDGKIFGADITEYLANCAMGQPLERIALNLSASPANMRQVADNAEKYPRN